VSKAQQSPLCWRRGRGVRLGKIGMALENGEWPPDMLEFANAVAEYQHVNRRSFPTFSELFAIMHHLGYRRVAPRSKWVGAD
jgi:hypothetical protein